jgi:hypothetical protein
MINVNDFNWERPGTKANKVKEGITAKPVAFIIGTEVVDVMVFDAGLVNLLCYANEFIDVSPAPNVFWVQVRHDGELIETLICGEKLYSILLSDPLILDYTSGPYRYARMVNTGWSYINDDLILPGYYE